MWWLLEQETDQFADVAMFEPVLGNLGISDVSHTEVNLLSWLSVQTRPASIGAHVRNIGRPAYAEVAASRRLFLAWLCILALLCPNMSKGILAFRQDLPHCVSPH